MISTHVRIFNSSSPFTNPLLTVPNTPITLGIIIIIIIIQFSGLILASYNSSLSLYPRPWMRESRDVCILCIYILCCLFWVIFFSYNDRILLRRWALSQSAMFCTWYWLGLPGILQTCLSALFFIIPRASTVVVIRCHIFSISISQSLYLLMLLYSLTGMLLSVGTDKSIRRHL